MSKTIASLGIVIMVLILLCGCGVWMSAEYSQLLDKTVVLSHETARRATEGTLSAPEMAQALNDQANTWQRFQEARDNK